MKLVFLCVCVIAALHAHYHATTQAAQLRRVWMQDHCKNGICMNIEIGRNDFVLLSQMPIANQIMLSFLNSSISKIPSLMFETFPDLQVLHMDNCSVDVLESPQFEGASNLKSLSLAHNQLRDIPKNIFLGAENLHSLTLNNNKIQKVHNMSFHALKELKELSLANNRLEHLPTGIFAPLRKLLDLDISGNLLQTFPRGIFDKNLNLTQINLGRNRFAVFESELFKLQHRITMLDLSGNVLQELILNFPELSTAKANNCDLRKLTVYGYVSELELRNNSLREVPHLQHAANVTSLDLSHNPLGAMRGNPLRRYIGLERLNLSAINMHDVPEQLFKKQTQLKILDISGNALYNMKFTIFDSLKSLEFLCFQQNNWNCDFLQLLMNSYVKRRDVGYIEDTIEPEMVDDYIDGVACWYENNKSSKKCDSATSDAAMELAIVRNDMKSFVDVMDKKFVKVYRMLDEIKAHL
ncbi:leucine-rich repeat-containing protein egg-6 [Teleopsis dalmanni]|uniref:leucine-rich repeat-containing protein egg-6 n=1 Tax=Teleopsis dalmanni TaxID=139649 RepID=UPI0018CF174E|nr:leucine-rich repeat-containing protein egg-6 [Teleopsis dalmanni]